ATTCRNEAGGSNVVASSRVDGSPRARSVIGSSCELVTGRPTAPPRGCLRVRSMHSFWLCRGRHQRVEETLMGAPIRFRPNFWRAIYAVAASAALILTGAGPVSARVLAGKVVTSD